MERIENNYLLIDGERGLQRMVSIGEQGFVDPIHSSIEIQMSVKENQIFWSALSTFIKSSDSVKHQRFLVSESLTIIDLAIKNLSNV